eukprot:2588155-Amphidinium_carterae.1
MSGRKKSIGNDPSTCLTQVLLLRLFDSLVPGVSDYVELERRRQDLQHHLLFFNAKGSERPHS